MSKREYSDYFSTELCDLLFMWVSPENYSKFLEMLDKEIEEQLEEECDNCDRKMPDERQHNEGYQ